MQPNVAGTNVQSSKKHLQGVVTFTPTCVQTKTNRKHKLSLTSAERDPSVILASSVEHVQFQHKLELELLENLIIINQYLCDCEFKSSKCFFFPSGTSLVFFGWLFFASV